MQTSKFSIVAVFCLTAFAGLSQSGAKWATNGNGISNGDFLGSTNNFPLLFKTNNVNRAQLTTNGAFQVFGLSGTGNRLLMTDANGNLIPFSMGTSSQVLYGNGSWGNLPASFNPWSASGSNIFYNGNVGINTNNPLVALDVVGDARISNNLYVGGGIVITDKVNASAEVFTAAMRADSIVMDSTRAIYGTTRVVGDVKLSQQLLVSGNTKLSGDLNMNGKFYMGGTALAIDYNGQNPQHKVFAFGSPVNALSANCTSPSLNVPLSYQFNGSIQTWGTASGGLMNVMDIGFDGASHFIEGAGFNSGTNKTPLLVNYYCGNDIYLNTGATPGFVGTGPNLEIGLPQRNVGIALNINAPNKTGLLINSTTANPYAIASQIQVDNNLTRAFVVNNVVGTPYESFYVYGDGTTKIGAQTHVGKLNVDGTIFAKEIKVTLTGWADYVFDKEYKLMPLQEVDSFITAHKHLPGVPNAAEMMQNGNNLAETDQLFMCKIEELTLYNIQLQKEQEATKKEVEELKKQMEEMKQLMMKKD